MTKKTYGFQGAQKSLIFDVHILKSTGRQNKRGQVAETITWFAAIFVILFMMIVFVLFSGVIAGENLRKKGQIRSIEAGVADYSSENDVNYQRLESFLNYRIEGKKIRDIISLDDKDEIIKLGQELNVPFELTYSCYIGGEDLEHCGKCSKCMYRKQAFYWAGIKDPTSYI